VVVALEMECLVVGWLLCRGAEEDWPIMEIRAGITAAAAAAAAHKQIWEASD